MITPSPYFAATHNPSTAAGATSRRDLKYIIDFHGKILSNKNNALHFCEIVDISKNDCVMFDSDNLRLTYAGVDICVNEVDGVFHALASNKASSYIEMDNAFFYYSSKNIFLSSNEDGQLLLTKLRERWEKFLPITEDMFLFLRSISLHGLHYTDNDQIIDKGSIELKSFAIQDGINNFPMEYNLDISIKNKNIYIADKFACIRKIAFRNPAVYFCALSSKEILTSVFASIESYSLYSEVDFSYVIFTNVENVKIPQTISHNRIEIINVESIGLIDHVYKRYEKEVIEKMCLYNPVIYSDADIVCNNSLKSLENYLTKTENIIVNTEDRYDAPTIENSGWFIASFKKDDALLRDTEIDAINSGFFGYSSKENMMDVSRMISIISKNIIKRHGLSHWAYDQSAFNYAIIKNGNYDKEYLKPLTQNWPSANFHEIPLCGIVHFCGGVGNFSSKSEKMRSYMMYLKNTHKRNPASDPPTQAQ